MEVTPATAPGAGEGSNGLLAIDDVSAVGGARRAVAELAKRCGLSEDAAGRLGIIATELATNLFRHARGGRLLWRAVPGAVGVELLAVDAGPGMADIERCLRDGFSSAGTAGNGLGAVRRLATHFDLWSVPGVGTVLLARVVEPVAAASAFRLGVVALPMAGEAVAGDAWSFHDDGDAASLLLVDGLGHGEAAAEAARAAVAAFRRDPMREPAAALAALHAATQGTRGGAAAIARIDRAAGRLSYAGVGNIAGVIAGGDRTRGLASHHGILGATAGRMQAFDHAWDDDAMLLMHSDGLQSRWTLDPALHARDPALVAGVLYRSHERGRDDLTVAVLTAGRRA